MARQLQDRVLSLWLPVKRYRCCAASCGWEGVLLARRLPAAAPQDSRR